MRKKRKLRLGKMQRALAREVWADRREKREALVQANLNSPKPKAVKYASLGPLSQYGTRARVSQLIIRKDPVKQRAMAEKKFGLRDKDLYDWNRH